ncbi:hypothetical protein ACN9M1_21360 [Ralstonia sp. R-29]|uniref:hypothetical protein n=1 Tax=Ralstonia sp. R-29 TaxID=3404059 RepID=UPI003CFB5EDB
MTTKQRLLALAWASLLAAGSGMAVAAGPTGTGAGGAPPQPNSHMKDGKVVPPPQPTVPTMVLPGMPRSLMREAEHGHSRGGAMAAPDAVQRQNGNVWVN